MFSWWSTIIPTSSRNLSPCEWSHTICSYITEPYMPTVKYALAVVFTKQCTTAMLVNCNVYCLSVLYSIWITRTKSSSGIPPEMTFNKWQFCIYDYWCTYLCMCLGILVRIPLLHQYCILCRHKIVYIHLNLNKLFSRGNKGSFLSPLHIQQLLKEMWNLFFLP